MELLPNEVAQKIVHAPAYYITTFGRVWSTNSNKWLKPTIQARGNHKRAYVSLGKGNKHYIHRLVAEAFIPNPDNLSEVDHIDTNGTNNHIDNLRWVTHTQNLDNPISKEKVKQNTGYYIEIEELDTGNLYIGYEDAASKTGYSKTTINNHVLGKVKNPKWRATGKKYREKP